MTRPTVPTRRSLQVLELLASGHTRASAGRQLHISENTVKSLLERTYVTLDAHSATHAVALAIGAGLINAPPSGPDRRRPHEGRTA